MHAGGRRKGKGRSRILYWFRTPPGVRVGRAALDEEAIRLIEEFNPEVAFDWTRILKGQGAETKPPVPQRDQRAERGGRRRSERATPPPRWPTPGSPSSGSPSSGPDLDSSDQQNRDLTPPRLGSDLDSLDQQNRDLTPGALAVGEEDEEVVTPERPAHARLGSEGLSRLRARYAEVLARISERIQDPVRQEELKVQAERLNPDTWVTDAEVSAGLEAYESVFEGLRGAIGGPSRRRRRKRRHGGGQPGEPAPGASDDRQTDSPKGEGPPDREIEDL